MVGKVAESKRSRVPRNLRNAVSESVSRSQDYFFNSQAPEGYWWGELESNATMEAEYLLLTHFLGIGDRGTWRKLANHLFKVQRDDGTWGQYYGAPGDLSTTVECLLCSQAVGRPSRRPTACEGATVHPLKGRCAVHTSIHQDMARPLWSVELARRSQSSTRAGAASFMVPHESL